MNPKPDHGRHVRSWAASFAALCTATCFGERECVRRAWYVSASGPIANTAKPPFPQKKNPVSIDTGHILVIVFSLGFRIFVKG